MVEINLTGTIFNQSGYDSHTRQLLNALYKLNNQIHLDCPKPDDWLRWCNTAEMNMINQEQFDDAVSIMINLPPFWKFPLSDKPKKFIGWCVWEGTSIPTYWCPILDDDRVTYVIVPSKHTYDAIFNTYKPKKPDKFKIIGHGVDLKLFHPKHKI